MIIKSILDTDLYKLTMQQAVIKLYPRAIVKYSFINRSQTSFPEGFASELRKEIGLMRRLKLSESERLWMQTRCYFLDPTYLDFLMGYRYDPSEVGIVQEGGDLRISIEGYWHRTILWEVPLMAIISELYFRMTGQTPVDRNARERNNMGKAMTLIGNGIHFADFGTRRRFSYEIQDEIVRDFDGTFSKGNFVGTSNVHLAHKYDVRPIGTHAHEWFSFHAAKFGYKMANTMAMEAWVNVYRGDLGIALPDTFTTDAFFKIFDRKFAKLYDGVRHDSGDPIIFAQKSIAHYRSLGIDPRDKTIIFSDGLDVKKAIEIKDYCRGKIRCSFGIGTNFTNDVGVTPLNMVIKMTSAKPEGEDWMPTIKLSDVPGKHTGYAKEIEMAKHILKIGKND
jgi:nicotinate phosphoribosyltransferase